MEIENALGARGQKDEKQRKGKKTGTGENANKKRESERERGERGRRVEKRDGGGREKAAREPHMEVIL